MTPVEKFQKIARLMNEIGTEGYDIGFEDNPEGFPDILLGTWDGGLSTPVLTHRMYLDLESGRYVVLEDSDV